MSSKASMMPKTFQQIVGSAEVSPRQKDTASSAIDLPILTNYTRAEQAALFKGTYTTDNDRTNYNALSNSQGVISYILPIHQQIANVLTDSRLMTRLAPEIKQASLIRVSSILSPTSLQTGVYTVNIKSIPGLSDDSLKKIADILQTFFNDTQELGKRSAQWIDAALYGAGCAPIFIFPTSQLSEMRDDGLVTGTTSFDGTEPRPANFKEQIDQLMDIPVFSGKSTNVTLGTESWTMEKKKGFYSIALEGIELQHAPDKPPVTLKELTPALETLTATLVKKIEEGDTIKISENPEIIKFTSISRKETEKKLHRSLDDYLNKRMQYKIDEMVKLDKYENTDRDNIGHPLMMELPPESVIPIHVPSDPSSHLGYFIIVDEFGSPLMADRSLNDLTDMSSPGAASTKATYQAVFGGSNGVLSNACGNYESQVVSKIYNQLLDVFMRKKLSAMGLDGVSIDKGNAIMATMFQRLLYNKQTRLVYVPTTLLKYICFDYRDNGTGRSLLEDIHYILSLRTTFQVAAIMGMARDSIRHRTLTVNMDSKEADPEGLIEMIGQTFINNERIRFSLDPSEITAGISRAALSIVPKGLQGCNFEIDKSVDSPNGSSANTELLDGLTHMIIAGLGVPYHALNNTDDAEYARSVITNNLFFAKQICQDHGILCPQIGGLIKTFTTYSPKLRSLIMEVIKEYFTRDEEAAKNPAIKEEATTGRELKKEVVANYTSMLETVIANITVSLPTPNIAPDKAIYEEFDRFSGVVEKYCDTFFSADLVPSDDQNSAETLKLLRANLRRTLMDEYMQKLGPISTTLPTDFSDLNGSSFTDYYQVILNITKAIQDTKKILAPAADGGFGGDAGGGFGMDGGEPTDMSMGGGEEGGMGLGEETTGMDEPEGGGDPTATENTPETPESTNETEENATAEPLPPTGGTV